MKREVGILMGGIILSLLLFAVIFCCELKFSYWGQFNWEPQGRRPDIALALASQERLLFLYHFVFLPFIGIALGFYSGALSRKSGVVALLAFLPFRLVYFLHDGFSLKSDLSSVVDLALAVVTALIVARFVSRPVVMRTRV